MSSLPREWLENGLAQVYKPPVLPDFLPRGTQGELTELPQVAGVFSLGSAAEAHKYNIVVIVVPGVPDGDVLE